MIRVIVQHRFNSKIKMPNAQATPHYTNEFTHLSDLKTIELVILCVETSMLSETHISSSYPLLSR